MPDEQRADAVMIRVGQVKGQNIFQRLADVHSRFGPAIGCKKGFLFPATGSQQHHFYAPRATDSILFPTDHDLAGRERYTWTDDVDGVRYGSLVPEAQAEIQPPA